MWGNLSIPDSCVKKYFIKMSFSQDYTNESLHYIGVVYSAIVSLPFSWTSVLAYTIYIFGSKRDEWWRDKSNWRGTPAEV